MAYVAVKGGTAAIEASLDRMKYERIKGRTLVGTDQIQKGLRTLVDQMMSEGSLYSESLAALAIKQAEGSPEEAVFLLRAYRSTLPRAYYSLPLDTGLMEVERRISASFKEIPGGQLLGASPDYGHRLLDFTLFEESWETVAGWLADFLEEGHLVSEKEIGDSPASYPRVVDYLRREGLLPALQPQDDPPLDVTKSRIEFPLARSQRLQMLTRGQTGAVTSLAYAVLRAHGIAHPNLGELRVGRVPIELESPVEAAEGAQNAYYIGSIKVTEAETFFRDQDSLQLGYGLCFGQNETKAIAMSLLDHSLAYPVENSPLHDEEFVLMHIDAVESTGFISHLKLPHYVTFQSELDNLRKKGKKGEQP